MSTSSKICKQYTTAVDSLRSHFNAQRDLLPEGETSSQYEFSTEIEGLDWLEEHLPSLAGDLLSARFRLRLSLTAHDFQAELQVRGEARHLEVDCKSVETLEDESLGQLSSRAIEALEAPREMLVAGRAGISIEEIYEALRALADSGAKFDLSLHIFLDKGWINKRLVSGIDKSQRPKVISFLFPEALEKVLRQISLNDFEKEFCQEGHRTIIPVFGFSGCLSSSLLAICGPDHSEELDAFLTNPPGDDLLRRAQKIREFRQSQGFWTYPTAWVTPETFALTAVHAVEGDVGDALVRHLQSFQGLLSAIYLADYVESHDDRFRVEYRGLGRVCIPVTRTSLLAYGDHLEDLYQLYVYAYEGLSADKLEIAQQFLSLIAKDLKTLCSRAIEVKDATKKTYDRALVEKVKDYFEARHKIQERIKTAVAETSSNVIDLSRDVSGDLYKIAGVVVGAVAGALLKPDLSLWAALGASLVVAVYMALVIFYHLRTIQQAYDLRMDQHDAYIRSFEDTLRTTEIEVFLGDKHLGKSRTIFREKKEGAKRIYLCFLLASLVVAFISICLLVSSGLSASSPTSPVPTPTL
jgi:hypothetical protein